ncbi:hypothetical protein [Paraburkholderia atlantica]|uniref:hypothetical protein n=1 Tax=Paraburkholderia atlantica TaxID=2654982 RepID=UPI0016075D5B|nr:hypothetical protein [Paraburkholderia atlantica]MBB5414074.1 putative membrane protein [Paraburkholderia atlantica]
MTPDQIKDVIEEIASWSLEERRAYIANLAMHSAEDAEKVKEGLKAMWEQRKQR